MVKHYFIKSLFQSTLDITSPEPLGKDAEAEDQIKKEVNEEGTFRVREVIIIGE